MAARHQTVALPSEGVVYSYSVIHSNPKLGTPPFALGYVNMEGPARIFGRISGEGLAIGARCVAVPDPEFGYAFDLIKG
ncbi:OB-fold domain-containing protein [Variovorax saccharolyticus]|uniref:OB-fold domain-containing protein n=1 Tax=Variovorax saccharolyticus TaxID=3053516 RepID=UPI002577F918|nr:OB-fold domain-containing protein [Variovorax sp. J22R187]MDM0021858.1 OB-fold domain-containing protein [Variovorax sp. J22R187]